MSKHDLMKRKLNKIDSSEKSIESITGEEITSEKEDSVNKKKRKLQDEDLVNERSKRIDRQVELNFFENSQSNRLGPEFFNEYCLKLSKKLLGKYLFRRFELNKSQTDDNNNDNNNKYGLLISKIVECEAYPGGNDQASHSFNGKQTNRNKAMFMKSGTAYVYNIYGMYCCLNISSKEDGGGVLIRALEPLYGIEIMESYRFNKKTKKSSKETKLKDLTNGPSKLCLALNITKNEFDQIDLSVCHDMWLQSNIFPLDQNNFTTSISSKNNETIISAKRIGIEYAGEEAINKLYRFYIKNNRFVSVKAKIEIEDLNIESNELI